MDTNGIEKLYENHSIQGTLIISIDNSTFRIQFNESVKVEVETSLNKGESLAEQDGASLHSKSIRTADKTLDKSVKLGDYIDISSFCEKVPMTNQQVLKYENGQLVPIVPFNQVSGQTFQIPESLYKITTQDDTSHNKAKKRRISTSNPLSKNAYSALSEHDSDGERQIPTDVVEEAEECDNVENDSFHQFSLKSEDEESSYQGETEQNRNYIDQDVSSMEVLNQELSVENDIENPDVSNTNGGILTVHYCGNCCKTFPTLQALKDHRKVKDLSEYNCDECCEVFPFKAFLQVHKKSNHGTSGASLVYNDDQYWYSCDDCGALVKTLVKLQIHNLNHTKEGYFQCCLCPEKFGERTDLRDHIKCHKSAGMIRCRWCNEWFANRYALAKHKLNCKEIKCYLCDSVFPNKTSRNQHYKDFHPNDILKCEICTYMFSSQEELDSHMEKHSRFKKKQCTLCGLFFSRLKKHMLVHKNPAEITENEIFYCDKCPAKFTKQCSFNRHVQGHIGDKPYQCPNCPRTFNNCGTLYKHIKRHASLLPYTCEVCGENCESIDQLKTHMLSHSEDDILFPCSVCTQSFMYRTSLETHMRFKHPQSLPSVPATVAKSESFTRAQEITAAAAFADDPNAMMEVEVVIPDLTGLDNAQNTDQYEIVIVHKK